MLVSLKEARGSSRRRRCCLMSQYSSWCDRPLLHLPSTSTTFIPFYLFFSQVVYLLSLIYPYPSVMFMKPPELEFWNGYVGSDPVEALKLLGDHSRIANFSPTPVDILSTLSSSEKERRCRHLQVVPEIGERETNSEKASDTAVTLQRANHDGTGSAKNTVQISSAEIPVPTPESMITDKSMMTFDSTIHCALANHVINPVLALDRHKHLMYKVDTREIVCALSGKLFCPVYVVSLSHGVGQAMRSQDQSDQNFSHVFSAVLQHAIYYGCSQFIISDYLTTGVFKLEDIPGRRLMQLKNQECRQVPVSSKIFDLSEVNRGLDEFFAASHSTSSCQLGKQSCQRQLCLHYYNALLLDSSQQILPFFTRRNCFTNTTSSAEELPLREYTINQKNLKRIQTGYSYYSQAFAVEKSYCDSEIFPLSSLPSDIAKDEADYPIAFLKVFDDSYYNVTQQVDPKVLFLTELKAYQILESLQGTIVPKIYNYGVLKHSPDNVVSGYFILMEYIHRDGGEEDEDDIHTQQSYNSAMDALGKIHKLGIAHGDISYSNICFTPSGSTKIIDFALSQNYSTASRTGSGGGVTSTNISSWSKIATEDFHNLKSIFTLQLGSGFV